MMDPTSEFLKKKKKEKAYYYHLAKLIYFFIIACNPIVINKLKKYGYILSLSN